MRAFHHIRVVGNALKKQNKKKQNKKQKKQLPSTLTDGPLGLYGDFVERHCYMYVFGLGIETCQQIEPSFLTKPLCCVLGQDTTLIVPLSLYTQVYKGVPANLLLRVTLRWTSIPSRGE